MPSNDTANEDTLPHQQTMQYFEKLWALRHYFVVEPFIFLVIMSVVLNGIAGQTFPLDKACRVNLGYSKLVCDTTLNKADLGFDCEGFSAENITFPPASALRNMSISDPMFNDTVCKAEIEAQKLTAEVSGIRAPVGATFLLIILLFGGSWADRYNQLKPIMIVPIIGIMLSYVCLLISAIFFDSVPMEFGTYLEYLIPAMFGGLEFCIVGVFSYITLTTPEEDRTFRFGIFSMFLDGLFLIGEPLSGILFELLGYILSFSLGLFLQLVAILYVVFYIDEIKPDKTKDSVDESKAIASPPSDACKIATLSGSENLAYEITQLDDSYGNKKTNVKMTTKIEDPQQHESAGKCSLVKEFFDPTLVKDLYDFSLAERENNGRLLLFSTILAVFLFVGPDTGERDFWFRYTVLRFGWNGKDNSYFETVLSIFSLLGVFIGTVILSKKLKFSDPIIGILATLSLIFSRIIYAFATNTLTFYLGGVVEMFMGLCFISLRAIGASIVAEDELSKLYSIFGISEPIGQFIFPPLFSKVYTSSLDGFKGTWLLIGEIFYIPIVLVFIFCYLILRRNKKNIKSNAVENGKNEVKTRDVASSDTEITSL